MSSSSKASTSHVSTSYRSITDAYLNWPKITSQSRANRQDVSGATNMCGLCAALNAGRDWTNAAGREQFKNDGRPISVSQERTQLVRLINGVLQHYGLTVND